MDWIPRLICVIVSMTSVVMSIPDFRNHECARPCVDGVHMTCKYTFLIENFYTMSDSCRDCPFNQSDCSAPNCNPGDGEKRGIITVNGQCPGPMIEVCEGDTVEVLVINQQQSFEPLTIHWHGVLQKGTPYMDGTALVAQCPISPYSKFTYRFRAEDPGTLMWHGHLGLQRSDGFFGAFIVRQSPSRDPLFELYDFDLSDHVIVIADWFKDMTLPTFLLNYLEYMEFPLRPNSILINGRGRAKEFTSPDNTKHYIPPSTFLVSSGKRYRFRVIQAGVMNCPVLLSIEGHVMLVTASDGHPIQAYQTNVLLVHDGERYDFILTALEAPQNRNYWIHLKGLGLCSSMNRPQVAILKYEGAPDVPPPEVTESKEPGSTVDFREHAKTNLNLLTSLVNDDHVAKREPDSRVYLVTGFKEAVYDSAGNRMFSLPYIDFITFSLTSSPPLTQPGDVKESQFCNASDAKSHPCNNQTGLCTCTHRLKFALGDLVELVLFNDNWSDYYGHPIHIHGYAFSVVGEGRLAPNQTKQDLMEMDARGELNRRDSFLPLKDTVNVPGGYYVIVRFKADNPGVWMLHCHIEFHVVNGMTLLVQVGEVSEWPKVPEGFPKCGDWTPP